MKKFIVIGLISLLIIMQGLLGYSNNQITAQTLEESLEKLIQVEMIQYGTPGVMVGMAQNGEMLFSTAMGYSDIATHEKMDMERTVMQTGSVSKTFTAYALLRAMEASGIQMEDEIASYMPSYVKQSKLNVTFRNVLTHTTGIASVKEDTAINKRPSLNPAAIRVVNAFSEEARRFYEAYNFEPVLEPDTYSIYSNVNSVIAGMLIEGITGQSYEAYLSDLLKTELDMETTAGALMNKFEADEHIISGYSVFGGVQTKTRGYQARLLPSDDFLTTQIDMNQFLKYLSSSDTDEIKKQLLTRQVQNDPLSYGRSSGFGITSILGHEVYLQDGGIPGLNVRLLVMPSENFAMFFVYNTEDTTFREALTEKIISSIFNQRRTEVIADYENEDLNHYIGAYTPLNASNETVEKLTQIIHQVRVVAKSDGLYIGKSRFIPYAQNSFYNADENVYAVFKLDEFGRLKYLMVDNTIYKRTAFFQSLIVEIALLMMAAFFNFLALLVILFKWQSMRVNRIHDTPRMVILIATLVASVLIGLITYAGLTYNSWDVIFGTLVVNNWIKIFSALGLVLIVPNWLMIKRGNEDFRWTGMMVLIFRIQEILNILLLIWLWRYNLLTF